MKINLKIKKIKKIKKNHNLNKIVIKVNPYQLPKNYNKAQAVRVINQQCH